MLRTLALTGALLLLSSARAPEDEEPDGNKLVRVELVADRDALQPNSTFTLAVKLAIHPTWHVYWENPGNIGMSTKADIVAPPGYVVGPLRFPTPHRHDQEGDIYSFIHEGETVLLADVTVPANAKSGERASFSVESRWLVCDANVCVTGSGKSAVDVVLADVAKPARDKEFTAWRAKLPRPWAESKARTMWSGTEAAPVLKIVVPGAKEVEFFPYRMPAMDMTARKLDAGKQGASATIEWEFERKDPADKPVARGVLSVKTSEGESSFVLESAFDAP